MPSFVLLATDRPSFSFNFWLLVIAESLSWLAFNFISINLVILPALAGLAAFFVFKKPHLALYLSLAELLGGGLGHSFEYGWLNSRLVIFTVIVVAFVIKYLPHFKSLKILQDKKVLYLWLAFILAIFMSVLVAWSRHHSWLNIFLDANAYLYLLYWPIWYQFYSPQRFTAIKNIFLASVVVISLKTLLFFNLFVQQYANLELYSLYQWIRDLRTGQITPMSGGWQRVFMPSQIYALLAWFFIFMASFKKPWSGKIFLLLGLTGSALLISLSRSFWLAGISLLFILLSIALVKKQYSKIAKGLLGLSSLILSFILVEIFFNLPVWKSYDIFSQRSISTAEPAANSRLELWPVMWQAIQESPYLGQGFGHELTYRSSDPRIKSVSNPQGWQTTFAFEWGWLDIWLKGGLLLGACFIAWFLVIFKRAQRLWPIDFFKASAAMSTVFLLALVHIFSPFLNHPLGLGPLMIFISILSNHEETS